MEQLRYTHILIFIIVLVSCRVEYCGRKAVIYLSILRLKAHKMTKVKIDKLILRFLKFWADHKHPLCM